MYAKKQWVALKDGKRYTGMWSIEILDQVGLTKTKFFHELKKICCIFMKKSQINIWIWITLMDGNFHDIILNSSHLKSVYYGINMDGKTCGQPDRLIIASLCLVHHYQMHIGNSGELESVIVLQMKRLFWTQRSSVLTH
jgi:hypothetical protein